MINILQCCKLRSIPSESCQFVYLPDICQCGPSVVVGDSTFRRSKMIVVVCDWLGAFDILCIELCMWYRKQHILPWTSLDQPLEYRFRQYFTLHSIPSVFQYQRYVNSYSFLVVNSHRLYVPTMKTPKTMKKHRFWPPKRSKSKVIYHKKKPLEM